MVLVITHWIEELGRSCDQAGSYGGKSCSRATTADSSAGVSHTLTNDQYKRLVSLLGDFGPSSYASQSNMVDSGFTTTFLFNIIDVSHLDIIVAHPNGTKAKVNEVGSSSCVFALIKRIALFEIMFSDTRLGHPVDQVLSFIKNDSDLKGDFTSEPCDVCHRAKKTREPFLLSDYKSEMVGINNLNFFDIQRSNVPYDDVRDNSEGGGTTPLSIDSVVETADAELSHTPIAASASTSNIGVDNSCFKTFDVNSDMLGSITEHGSIDDGGAAPENEINISKGEDLNIYDLDILLQTDEGIPEHRTTGGPQILRKSNRKSVMPSKLNDHLIDSEV
nr:ribonuclease H-like domain-containing protein [Tanacetum cinerariifolium]